MRLCLKTKNQQNIEHSSTKQAEVGKPEISIQRSPKGLLVMNMRKEESMGEIRGHTHQVLQGSIRDLHGDGTG